MPEEKVDKPGNEETEKVKPHDYKPRIKSIGPGSTKAQESEFFRQEAAYAENVKPNWMAIRMSVLTGDRTKAELRKCGCDQCNLALEFMTEAGE